jgi:hypothetical membrane protein
MLHLRHIPGSAYGHRTIARWTLWSAFLAPVSLVTCWIASGIVQRGNYNAVQQTISVLASDAATHPWIMTVGLYSVGTCQIVTALGLSVVRPWARIVLALGGVTGLGVAVFPQAQHGGGAVVHLTFATLCVSMLAVWPATMGTRAPSRPIVLSIRGSLFATFVFMGLLAWLYSAAHGGGALGVAERVDTTIGNSWPLVVVLAVRHASRVQRRKVAGFLDPATNRNA